ncbi:MAG: hypothetical protein ABEJ94_08465 [Halorientalis sp.]
MVATPVPDVAPVLADLDERGYDVTRLDTDGPAAVAAGGDPPGAVTDRPLAVEPLADPTPLSLVARLASAAGKEQAVLFVCDPEEAARARAVLSDPLLLREATDGCRAFYAVPDRIQVQAGGYACVRTDGELTWREEPAGGGVGTADDPEDTGPRLLLETEGRAVAAFDSVAGLTCPGPTAAAFPYRYRWGEDRHVHVLDGEREVGRYPGVAAMKENAYRPVPLPLVPEHHLRENTALARHWTLATVADGAVEYETAVDV